MSPDPERGFPRIYAVAKWTVVALLVILAITAAAFWTVLLGEFSASGFRAQNPSLPTRDVAITPECAWPYPVEHREAQAVCRMYYHMSPKQREEALRVRSGAPTSLAQLTEQEKKPDENKKAAKPQPAAPTSWYADCPECASSLGRGGRAGPFATIEECREKVARLVAQGYPYGRCRSDQ